MNLNSEPHQHLSLSHHPASIFFPPSSSLSPMSPMPATSLTKRQPTSRPQIATPSSCTGRLTLESLTAGSPPSRKLYLSSPYSTADHQVQHLTVVLTPSLTNTPHRSPVAASGSHQQAHHHANAAATIESRCRRRTQRHHRRRSRLAKLRPQNAHDSQHGKPTSPEPANSPDPDCRTVVDAHTAAHHLAPTDI